MNTEAFYNSPALNRFVFPSSLFWGTGSQERLVDFLHPGTTEFFVDKNVLPVLSPSVLGLFGSSAHIVDGLPLYETALEIYNANSALPTNIVAIGGGSTLDLCKAVSALRLFGHVENLGIGPNSGRQQKVVDKSNYIALPTTVGSGAECSRYFVLYKKESKEKVHGKSWALPAQSVIIDSLILKYAKLPTIVSSAFDAFIHFVETSICNFESNYLSKEMSYFGVRIIMENLVGYLQKSGDEGRHLMNLALSASIAGVAISNVRTGNIHEAAGALFEHTELSHGQCLYVFAANAMRQYPKNLQNHLHQMATSANYKSFDHLMAAWASFFQLCGSISKINLELKKVRSNPLVFASIVSRLEADSVWNKKESPTPYSADLLEELAQSIFEEF